MTDRSLVLGLHLLRYVPFDYVSGQRGNITFVYIYVRPVGIISDSTSQFYSCAPVPIDNCNIVLNVDFEQNVFPPSNLGQITRACGWNNGNQGLSDYLRTNATLAALGIPNNFNGQQNVFNGVVKAYAGFASVRDYSPYSGLEVYKEILVTKLKTPLLQNASYQLTFNISIADNRRANPFLMQALLSSVLPNQNLAFNVDIPLNPNDILIANTNFVTNNLGWDTVTLNFTTGATAGLEYLYIGALNQPQNLQSKPRIGFGGINTSSYNYIDNVSLIPTYNAALDLPANLCGNKLLSDLSNFVQNAPPKGVFSGTGVTVNDGSVYSFNPNNFWDLHHNLYLCKQPSLPRCNFNRYHNF